jgi:hypothetical protein
MPKKVCNLTLKKMPVRTELTDTAAIVGPHLWVLLRGTHSTPYPCSLQRLYNHWQFIVHPESPPCSQGGGIRGRSLTIDWSPNPHSFPQGLYLCVKCIVPEKKKAVIQILSTFPQ